MGQLLKRSTAGGSLGNPNYFPSPVPFPCAMKFDIVSWLNITAGSPNILSWPLFCTDYISVIGSMFAFRRGSYRMKNSVYDAGTAVAPTATVYAVLGKSTTSSIYASTTYARGL